MRDPTPDYPFFAYFHKAKAEGLTDAEAYHWAISEDLYRPDGVTLLQPGEPRPMGYCYHPASAVENQQPADRWHGQRVCTICYSSLIRRWVGPLPEREIYWAPPCKIPTRSETAVAAIAQPQPAKT